MHHFQYERWPMGQSPESVWSWKRVWIGHGAGHKPWGAGKYGWKGRICGYYSKCPSISQACVSSICYVDLKDAWICQKPGSSVILYSVTMIIKQQSCSITSFLGQASKSPLVPLQLLLWHQKRRFFFLPPSSQVASTAGRKQNSSLLRTLSMFSLDWIMMRSFAKICAIWRCCGQNICASGETGTQLISWDGVTILMWLM